MHSFEVHSNESMCRKSGRLGLEQVSILPFLLCRLTEVGDVWEGVTTEKERQQKSALMHHVTLCEF